MQRLSSRSPVFAALALSVLTLSSCSGPAKKNTAGDAAAAPTLVRPDFKKGELEKLCNQAMADAKAALDRIAQVPPAQRTIENTLLAFESATADFSDRVMPLTFMGYVSRDAATHDEGSACEERVNQFGVEALTRKDLYEAIRGQKPRSAGEKRLLSETMKGFVLNGLKLPDAELARVKELKKQLALK